MQRQLILVFGLAVVLVGVGYAWYVVAPPELPEPYGAVLKDVFPEDDFQAAAPGTPVARVYASFGRTPPRNAADARCAFFQYDSLLFDGALVILTNQEHIDRRWLMKGSDRPPDCDGVPREIVDLKGWYAAAVRVR